ncbi:MAG TPA: hypothetical protein VNO70_21645 [Blastocatellia bacterium]|nr:hypothetical protein [Blastocatellia bacterium]
MATSKEEQNARKINHLEALKWAERAHLLATHWRQIFFLISEDGDPVRGGFSGIVR